MLHHYSRLVLANYGSGVNVASVLEAATPVKLGYQESIQEIFDFRYLCPLNSLASCADPEKGKKK